jgi:hypothetical protein
VVVEGANTWSALSSLPVVVEGANTWSALSSLPVVVEGATGQHLISTFNTLVSMADHADSLSAPVGGVCDVFYDGFACEIQLEIKYL